MVSFDFISEKLAGLQAGLDQADFERQETRRQHEINNLKQLAAADVGMAIAAHVKKCQESEDDFVLTETYLDGVVVRLSNFYDENDGERKTEIRASHPELDEMLLVVYTSNSVCVRDEWVPVTSSQ